MRRALLPLALVVVVLWIVAPLDAGIGRSQTQQGVSPMGTCPDVQNTPLLTLIYGSVVVNGQNAAVGTIIEALSPRGDTVGCFEVTTAGSYGLMYVYGEDTSVTPAIPGMRVGETIAFYVDGTLAVATPELTWMNDKATHEVSLVVSVAVTPTPVTPTPTPVTPTATPVTPTATPVTPTATPVTPTITPTSVPTLDAFAPASLWFAGFKYFGPQNRNPRLLGDISGDGMDDVVAFDPATELDPRGTIIALSTGTGFAKQSLWTHDFNWKGDNYYHREVGDVNGDGKDDIVGFWYGEGVYVGLSSGTALAPATEWLDGLKWWGPQNRYPRLLGDVNGDGKADIVAICPDPNASEGTGVYVSLSTGSAFIKPARSWTDDFGWLGDNNAHRDVGDVNGDGRDDIVGYVAGDGVYVGLSTGSSFADSTEWLDGVRPWGPQATYPWTLGDVDDDGYEDIVAYQTDGQIWVAFSTGTSFEDPVQCSVDLSWLDDDWRNVLQVGNVDGVNGVDLVAFKYGVGVYVATATTP